MEIKKIIDKRHSVRQYTDKPIEFEKRAVLDNLAEEFNSEANLNIQIIYDDTDCFNSFMAHYGKFSGVSNYIALVGKKSDNSDELLGYYGEKLVLKAQEMGLNTCWVALTHGKSKAVVRKGEKQVCLISLGYGKTEGVEHKSKPIQEVCNCTEKTPDWFIEGVKSALKAPTAMNQQKFYFELLPDETVKATAKKGFYTKLDLGIVKCHFEAVTDKKVLI